MAPWFPENNAPDAPTSGSAQAVVPTSTSAPARGAQPTKGPHNPKPTVSPPASVSSLSIPSSQPSPIQQSPFDMQQITTAVTGIDHVKRPSQPNNPATTAGSPYPKTESASGTAMAALPQNHAEPAALRVRQDGNKPRVRKILSLDGGGVRGLSSLIILDYVMDMLGNLRGARLEPWQEFDMIAGTSTGGLIALMLGRLRMSVAACIAAYKELSHQIFTPAHNTANAAGKSTDFLQEAGKFRSEPLEQCMKGMLRDHGLSDEELVMDGNLDSPAVFVCAVEGVNSDAVVIRSYKSKEFDDLYGFCRIWEAARATSAASTFFDPIKIRDRMYVDGALKHNNPIEKVDEESQGKLECLSPL